VQRILSLVAAKMGLVARESGDFVPQRTFWAAAKLELAQCHGFLVCDSAFMDRHHGRGDVLSLGQ
jgi:hypothetical protein